MAPAEAALGPQAGVTAAVRGSVLLTEIDQPSAPPQTATDGTAIYLGHDIRAGAEAGTQLMLLDQTSVTLGEHAEIAVDDFLYDPERNLGQLAVSVRNGAFRLVTGAISEVDPANTIIRTPTALIGVRGTIVLSRVTAAGSLIALAGPGAATDSRDRIGAVEVTSAQGSVLLTRPGFATFVAPGKAPEAPRPLTAEESASLNQELSHEGGTGQVLAYAPTGPGDASGSRRATGGLQVGALASRNRSDATATALNTGLVQGTRYGRTPSPDTPRLPLPNVQGQGDPTQPWFPQDGGLEQGNERMVNSRDTFRKANPLDIIGYSGTATYDARDIPLYHLNSNNPDDFSWGTLQNFDNLARVGSYEFSATVDFDQRTISARFFNAVIDDRIRIAEIATLQGNLAADAPPTFSASRVPVRDSRALATTGLSLLNSREGDAGRLLRQTLILEQGGYVFGNVTNIKGIGPMWQGRPINTASNGLDTPLPGLATESSEYGSFAGVATYVQSGIPLNVADIDGAFTTPAGSYDLDARIDFSSREVVINASSFHFDGDVNTYGTDAGLHLLDESSNGLVFSHANLMLAPSAGEGPDGLYTITRMTTQMRDLSRAPEDVARLLLQTLKISVDGTPTYESSVRILGDFTNVTRP